MDVKFNYEFSGKGYFGKIFRPVAKVSFKSQIGKLWSDVWMVVDTGADFTILPRYVSNDLGISLENDCILDTTVGVGGEQKIYLYKQKIKAKIGKFLRQVPLAFFDSDEVPPLLGRLGFLETFDTTFLKLHKTVFKN
ncbi:MAG: hypothetical protein UR39_C0001G0032 [Candidatus Woesebacteria bacterium GW2011_GWA1_33_30]|uniref:Peptidase A2 domain-containing protein n=1 Tax=Candidatus Woesebacteria bacterium GW2011_GWA2_33_28 TaxID=1618561 RepID=A0A0G0CXY6_9BACT|nr:MAG: hypothetical protein UR38_C0001G0033 [Candidatus Woesebacteria bacterium GW2011_GWA2_33_28]KKP48999.1 MAG: hypothetical protein UR39_C0001G0032 [Candidatus Woesebacteria bacterium GW2011_GWA1_33_30]KKP49893.1 MAG: hypothetical protein UR40_C0003G0065 [Microgenomates group bacterium GW2011_GWC1_33_32]KKP52591.1 MAG: hypothetical protein UR44_C0001G0033 [Candidatus Woesebacteria bacterium GW2011_GWB1_33_38]KKP55775.1 MAG: hypothetical protein UR48_C0051G0009 [Microgenomates group bacteriu